MIGAGFFRVCRSTLRVYGFMIAVVALPPLSIDLIRNPGGFPVPIFAVAMAVAFVVLLSATVALLVHGVRLRRSPDYRAKFERLGFAAQPDFIAPFGSMDQF
jgi:hypothetical protein